MRRSAMLRLASTLRREVIGERELLGRRRHFVERAVDAVTNFELVLEGLEVDVGGLVADGLADARD
jgi:hypothetical protein